MARQKLGQHFLNSPRVLERIASAACANRVELAVEIGPGLGALTSHLLERADRVVALEIDSNMADKLRARWQAEPRLEIRLTDALKADYDAFGPGVLVGNLPYYAATAMISRYLRCPGRLRQGVFLIQKEVAKRITAEPGGRDYGYFSVECQLLARAEYLFSVPPGAFRPPPEVDSAVIRLIPAAHPAPDGFLDFVSACFRQRRKTLKNNLAGTWDSDASESVLGKRAEQLSLAELIALCERTEKRGRLPRTEVSAGAPE
jgi:16S rRNA (adenine1518-N6/adenine1519-N6)-dimethyltransferase